MSHHSLESLTSPQLSKILIIHYWNGIDSCGCLSAALMVMNAVVAADVGKDMLFLCAYECESQMNCYQVWYLWILLISVHTFQFFLKSDKYKLFYLKICIMSVTSQNTGMKCFVNASCMEEWGTCIQYLCVILLKFFVATEYSAVLSKIAAIFQAVNRHLGWYFAWAYYHDRDFCTVFIQFFRCW